MTRSEFRKKLEELINEESMERGSDTPDFILATYLSDCLKTFDSAVAARDRYYEGQSFSSLNHHDICQSTCDESHRYDVTCCFNSPPPSVTLGGRDA